MQAASGRVAEALAEHYAKVCVCARVLRQVPPDDFDSPLDIPNLEFVEQPSWKTTAGSLLHVWGFGRAYFETCRRSDVVLVRGMCPYTALLYLAALVFRRPVCHWIVGDPVALLRAGTRQGSVVDFCSLLYALQDRWTTRMGRWLANGALLCNGRELARAYASSRTTQIVSSTVTADDFFERTDTCQGPVVRILFVGFVRPEKGIEYLLEAVSRLCAGVPWELEIVGPREFPDYGRKLDCIAERLGVADRVRWSGYVPNGRPLFERMRAADLFVLPTLSEGTPHVLVEARANGLPCIATNVGGIPTMVADGHDALLVPRKDSRALARAIELVVRDSALRQRLIRNGAIAARQQTLDRFVHAVLRELDSESPAVTKVVSAGVGIKESD
jgi:glycosyltransferase involved in cell wall biosynthesis